MDSFRTPDGSALQPCPFTTALAVLLVCLGCDVPEDSTPAPWLQRTLLQEVVDGGAAAPLDLEATTIGLETRPAMAVAADAPLNLVASASGHLTFAAATGSAGSTQTLMVARAAAPASEALRFEVAHAWTAFDGTLALEAGEIVTLWPESGAPIHLSDPMTLGPAPGPRIPLVLVVMIDTLRADHTSLTGYAVDTTPNLARLAQDGAFFQRAYTPASWTRPSTASLLTSVAPERHRTQDRLDRLGADQWTWSEAARAEGYQTVAISANPNVLPIWGFEQGFGRFIDFDSYGWVKKRRDAADLFRRAGEIIDEEGVGRGVPLFLYLHPIDPHHPYKPPVEVTREIYPDFSDKESGRELRRWAKPRDVRSAIRRYDGEIRHTDAEFGRLLDGLKQRGLYDPALIIVVGDHGEEFFDHGGLYHGRSLYEEQLRVPMIIKLPRDMTEEGVAGARIDALTSIADALPTAAEAAGWETPAGLQGRSLLGLMRGGPPVHEQLLASLELDGRRAHALIRGNHKLIRILTPKPTLLLFDLDRDPGELAPLDDPEPRIDLERRLDRELARHSAGWHLRVCGGSERGIVSLRIEGVGGGGAGGNGGLGKSPVRKVAFEADDELESRGDTLELRVRTGATVRPKEGRGKLIEVTVRDADEMIFAADRIRITRGDEEGETQRAALVLRRLTRWDGPLEVSREMARRPAGATPRCGRQPRATVQLWYIDEARASPLAEPDELLRARLQELGYLESDSESAPLPVSEEQEER